MDDTNREVPVFNDEALMKKFAHETVTKTTWSRWCELEEDTKQLLGMEWNSVGEEWNNEDKKEVVKNFRY